MWRRLLHWVIILFCLWHMFCVLIYVIPDENFFRPITWTVHQSMPYVRPYMNATSQWQKWNIFAPDPIRRVSEYYIDIEENGHWRSLTAMGGSTLAWQFRTKELKVLRQLEDTHQMTPLYLGDFCRQGKAPAGAHVMMVALSYVIPVKKELEAGGGFAHYKRKYITSPLGDSYCPTGKL